MACERKLLESEATTGFFVLLGTKGKKDTLEWCMKANLIASRYESKLEKGLYWVYPNSGSQIYNVEKNRGDNVKGYRIWIPEEDKVVESCNVSFCQVDQNSSYSGAVLVLEISDVKEDEDELVDSVEIGEKYLMKISQVPVCSLLIRWYLKDKRQIPEKVKMTMGTNHPFLLHVKSFEQEKS
ncbi:hypothetical protein TNCV_969181 [Trichonephila clavipes]|nr:hypothetical protein TNCV_969181 [Trichonephila clavipes]